MQYGQLLGSQTESFDKPRSIGGPIRNSPSRFRRRRSMQIGVPQNHSQGLLGSRSVEEFLVVQRTGDFLRPSDRPSSRLEELKARTFTVVGREERIARSLAALQREPKIQLSEEDWQWLDLNGDLEDEFE